MTHEEEIKYWAEHKNGTRVWTDEEGEWKLTRHPKWYSTSRYIVDDEWAEFRKMQADGTQFEHQISWNDWEEDVMDHEKIRLSLPEYWRIKQEEPIKELRK